MHHFFSSGSQPTHYWLKNAHVPIALLTEPLIAQLTAQDPTLNTRQTRDGLVQLDLEIGNGRIIQIQPSHLQPSPSRTSPYPSLASIDLRRGMLLPGFVELHTHLDKGHIWERSPNSVGSFAEALATVETDCEKYWTEEDVYRRMEFGLKCSYAHGTTAIRTHIDSYGEQAAISLRAFKALQDEWRDRLTLQAVTLVSLDYFLTDAGEKLADLIAEVGGVLGGFPHMDDQLDAQLDRVFAMAKERELALDFHTDESGDPRDITLRHVAQAALRHEFARPIVCGHCCSLAVQPAAVALETLDWVKQAGIGVVSLPMCNLFLQDRNQSAAPIVPSSAVLPNASTQTPRWRGITLLHELKHSGIPVAVSSDNCRDPFYGYGDHDGLEVLTQATRIAQLDAPYGDWCRTVTMTPANLMELQNLGRINVGMSADLVLFKARYFSELFSRPQHDRIVLRQGRAIDTTLPDYAELDDLLGVEAFI